MILLLPVAVSAVGNISVSSVPSGATILLNGATTGSVTPATIENIPAGSLPTILLQKSGYQDISQTNIGVSDNTTSIVSLTMTAVVVAPIISSISPVYGYNTSSVNNVVIYGSGFSTSGATVVLAKSGQTNITGTISSASATQLTCSFPITGKSAGTWNVIETNADGQSATLSGGFEIRSASSTVTLSSIVPSSAVTNTTASITSLTGTNFLTSATMRLKRAGYNDIYGTVSTLSSTTISGTFDLTNQVPGDYQVCVINPSTEAVCGLSFAVISASEVNGSIYIRSSPSISKIFLNGVYKGYSPMTLDNITPNTYTVLIRNAGYNDYSESVKVTAGKTSSVFASLMLTPDVTTARTTVPTTTVSTVKTTKKSTLKTPTPWPTSTPTQSSPISILAILGTIGAALIVLRKQ
ncbi:MAG: PEGA domain-containing protein [Methanoregula sp.]|nr:PEGA domain-containing protein [Methanoregula sp.]